MPSSNSVKRKQDFLKYVAMVNANPTPKDSNDITLVVWRKYNEWACHPSGFYDINDRSKRYTDDDKHILEFVNGLIEYGPFADDSDYVVCRCGRIMQRGSHYRCKYHSGHHEWCHGCLEEIEAEEKACEINDQ